MPQLNNLYFYFFCSQLLFLPVYFYSTPLFYSTVNTDKAIWMHMIGLAWSAIGYATTRFAHGFRANRSDNKPGESPRYRLTSAFYIVSYAMVVVGLAVAILQIALFVPLMEYLSKLFSSAFEENIRVAYLLSSEEGGLPGVIKMFAQAPLAIYLMSMGLLTFIQFNEKDRQRLKYLALIALGAVIIKVLFSLDRLTVMAVLLANLFVVIKSGYMKKIRYWLLMVAIFVLADYLSMKRLENLGLFDFIALYLKMGLINFQLMIDTCTQHTYGFSTFLMPLVFVFKFFQIPLPDFLESDFAWEWNPAQYFSSFAFQDFGYFYFIAFYFIGLLLNLINKKALNKSLYGSAIYFAVLYGAVSFIFVPAIRGVEFWLAILLPTALLNRCSRIIHPDTGELETRPKAMHGL